MRVLILGLLCTLYVMGQNPDPVMSVGGGGGSGGGSGTVTEVSGGTGINCINGTTTPECSLIRSVVPYKGLTTDTSPASSGFASGDIQVVDTDGTPQFHVCATDDGGAPPSCTLWVRLGRYTEVLLLAGGTLTGQLITDNLGIEFEESDTNPTCAAGNFNIYADASENKLKACQNGTPSDLVGGGSGSVSHVLYHDMHSNVGAGLTRWSYHGSAIWTTSGAEATNAGWVSPVAGTITAMHCKTNGTNGADGTLVITFRKNASNDTTFQVTVGAGAAAGVFSDTTGTVSMSLGDQISYEGVDTGGTNASAVVAACWLRITE